MLSTSERILRREIPKSELRAFLAMLVDHMQAEGANELRLAAMMHPDAAIHRANGQTWYSAASSVELIAHDELQLTPVRAGEMIDAATPKQEVALAQ